MATGDATRFIQRLIDEQQFRGRTSEADLLAAFHDPARGTLLVDPLVIKRIIKKHQQLPELIYHVPRAEAYTLPAAELYGVLDELDPVLRDEWKAQIATDHATLIAKPDADELDTYAIEHFGLAVWARLSHAAVHLHCAARAAEGGLDQGFLRRAIATLGLVEFEEVREVLSVEHRIFNVQDDAEVLVEFAATWVELAWFSPELLQQYFPSLVEHTAEVEALLAAMDVDPKELIKGCRPPHTPTLPGLETRRDSRRRSAGESLEIHQFQFHLGKLMGALEVELTGEEGVAESDADLLKRLEPLVHQIIGQFIKKERIVRGVTFDDLRKRFLVEEHRSARALLLLDTVLSRELGRLYRPARPAERAVLEKEGDQFLARVLEDPGLREATDRTIGWMDEAWTRYREGKTASRILLALAAIPGLLALVTYRWWLDLVARRTMFHRTSALRLFHRRCRRQMRAALARARAHELRGNRVRAALALRHALALVDAVGSRHPTEAFFALDRTMREHLTEQLVELADAISDGHGLTDAEHRATVHDMVDYLVDRAEGAPRGRELRMLYDLQASVQKAQREYAKLDIRGFLISLGRQPLVRDLPDQPAMMAVKHLRAAREKLGRVKVKRADIKRFGGAIDAALARHAGALRETIDRRVAEGLREVGIVPATPREQGGERKLRGDLTDLAIARAQFTFPEVRDAISRNDLKLPDLAVDQVIGGDPLLQIDEHYRKTLFGVYSGAPIYLRLLQRVNAPVFGTSPGRLLTRYILLPVVTAIVLIEGGHHTVGVAIEKITQTHTKWLTPESLAITSLMLLCVINFAWGWAIACAFGRLLGRGFSLVFRLMRAVLMSRALVLFSQLVLLPLLLAGVVATVGFLIEAEVYSSATVQEAIEAGKKVIPTPDVTKMFENKEIVRRLGLYYILGYLISAILLNTVFGRRFRDWINHLVADTAHRLKKTLWTGLVVGIINGFAAAMAWLEHLRYTVENSLRFTKRDGSLSFVAKSILGIIWFWISYFLVLYITLLVEPQVNPIKHFPVVTVSHKFMIPILPAMTRGMVAITPDFIPQWISYPFIGLTVFLIPGLCGFLVWELKENWKLYRATRPDVVKPVLVGSHGETLPRLLRKGFHSGTVPKTLAKLRRAGREAHASGDWSRVNKLRHALHHVEEDLERFAERSLIGPIRHDPALGGTGLTLTLGHPRLTNNKISLPLTFRRGESEFAMRLHFEDVFSWIIGSCSHDEEAYRAFFSERERVLLDTHLAVFFKQSGVELVREQVEQVLIGRLAVCGARIGAPEQPVLSYEIQDDRVFLDVFDQHGVALLGRIGCMLLEDPATAWIEKDGQRLEDELEPQPVSELVFSQHDIPWDAVDTVLSGGDGSDVLVPISRLPQASFRGIR